MYNNKRVLLLAGGGTLGSYTAAELLRLGCYVDIICLEDNVSDNERLCYYKGYADLEYLKEFLKNRHYDGIVNFIHYFDTQTYKPVHMLLTSKTDHLIFLSSYRVYADFQTPVTETAPQLYDIVTDKKFLETEDYAVPKSKNELFIKNESGTSNWTKVRPVITFSDRRLDIVTLSGRLVLELTEAGKEIFLPKKAKNLTAGLDWAGNSGKLIANLLFKENALCEAFTVSSAQNLTWGEAADIYTELLGAKFNWVDTERYIEEYPWLKDNPWMLKYDRLFDRKIDNSKILKVTELKKDDFTSIREGIKYELEKINKGEVKQL